MRTGLDVIISRQGGSLRGRKLGLLFHSASFSARCRQTPAELTALGLDLKCLFGPQHGVHGETQDNMIEWEGTRDRTTGLPLYSLYGKSRKPAPAALAGIDALVIDLQDVGTRFYTYIWTMLLCMEACAQLGKKVVILDRPNPIGGLEAEGPVLEDGFRSFVGMAPIPLRHSLTMGELALYLADRGGIEKPEVILMEGWNRRDYFEATGLEWGLPSPNMPSPRTALVYPGMGLLEGTNISEGRGTTRPFEIAGAPYIEAERLAGALAAAGAPGAVFRPLCFQPTFDKWQGALCGGVQLHVTDKAVFKPCLAAVTLISAVRRLWPDKFGWRRPPFEYEEKLPPFDILSGTDALRKSIEAGMPPAEIAAGWEKGCAAFKAASGPYLQY